ncbi:hypothetical protein [Hyphomicrobium sp.]|jgi:hypothetical protein|uniref:hypothetical protein n=1 Tax=Hyphomicrobium sp. TaxID=82 RepID=UPI002CE91020|nr:hypothetical protein [Hyphomicrobium sp.]HVZ04838.1 hypothetical protein [Hyphomicrobium sp.]
MKEPAPDKARRLLNLNNMVFLAFILIVGPLAWSLDLLVKFVLASNACLSTNPSHEWLFAPTTFIVIDIVAFAITAVATWAAYESWNATAPQHVGNFHAVTEVGEGRQHFLAFWGMMIGAMFLSAIVFSFIVILMVQPCTS